jgi:hypothetical protein
MESNILQVKYIMIENKPVLTRVRRGSRKWGDIG